MCVFACFIYRFTVHILKFRSVTTDARDSSYQNIDQTNLVCAKIKNNGKICGEKLRKTTRNSRKRNSDGTFKKLCFWGV